MPPRARKTAAPAPSLDESATPETAVPQEVAPPAVEDTAGGTEQAPAQPAAEPVPDAVEDVAAPAAATATYHWTPVSGGDPAPCRLCAPAGPPPGAGSFGCGHGQWVRVVDEAT